MRPHQGSSGPWPSRKARTFSSRFARVSSSVRSSTSPSRRAFSRSARRKHLPSRDLAKAFGAYLRPGFHPAEQPTLALSRSYLAESPAVRRLAS